MYYCQFGDVELCKGMDNISRVGIQCMETRWLPCVSFLALLWLYYTVLVGVIASGEVDTSRNQIWDWRLHASGSRRPRGSAV